MTSTVLEKLHSLNIQHIPVPANMTHLFQPLDLSVNGSAKKFMRKAFTKYYSTAVKEQLDSGKALDDISVDLRLTVMKPLHAQWLVDMYNYFTTERGQQIIMAGWAKSSMLGLIDGTVTDVPPADPFHFIYQ